MSPADLRRIGHAMFGSGWREALAYELGVAVRVVERWESGTADMPASVWTEVADLLRYRTEMTEKVARLYADRLVALKALSSPSINADKPILEPQNNL